ncbi:MAG: polysaccharide biosynthesis/export family protein [Dysgonomonas sp.]
MKRYLPISFLIAFISIIIASCSTYKEISYFQDLDDSTAGILNEDKLFHSMQIRPDDELSITVTSIDPLAATPFNSPLQQSTSSLGLKMPGESVNSTGRPSNYLVDTNGDINFPVLGKIHIAGMTKDEAVTYFENRLKEYIKDPIVNIRIVNFKVSVLGEVNMPGSYYFSTQRVSILDAIASAQDLTTHGRRSNVLVIREDDGKKEYFKVDLTKTDMFSSPNFYLQQNDIVYVTPNKEKQRDANSGLQKQFNLSIISSTIGWIISVIAIVVR